MSIFLGFFPDNKSNNEIASVAEDVKEIFDDLGIKVRWSNPCTYHSTLLFLGKSAFPLKVFIIKNKLKKFQFKKFKVKFNSVKLGISRPVSYTHLRAHETVLDLVCRLLLEKKNPPLV